MDTYAVIALKSAGNQALKLAEDLERGKLWPGDFTRAIGNILKALEDAKRQVDRT